MNTNNNKEIKTWLPIFPGFYGTLFEPNEEPYIEDGKTYEDYDFDYDRYYNDTGIYSCDAIEKKLQDWFPSIKVKYEEVISPAFYNYTNDSINCTISISEDDYKKLLEMLGEKEKGFSEYLRERYTSRSGFMSFYSPYFDDWMEYLTDTNDTDNLQHCIASALQFILLDDCYDQLELYYDLDGKVDVDFWLKEKA